MISLKTKWLQAPLINIFSGYWNIIVYGRKHSYRLYTKMLNEAMRWTAAIQGVIDSKTPIETPTLQLIRDIKVDFIPALSLDSSLLSLTLTVFPCPLRRTAWTRKSWSRCTGGTPSSDTPSTLCTRLCCPSLMERSPAVSTTEIQQAASQEIITAASAPPVCVEDALNGDIY